MKPVYPFFAALLFSGGALAQNIDAARPPEASDGQVPAACMGDLTRLCSDKSLKLECLVQQWTRVSSGCQDSLAKPMRAGSD